MTQAFILVTCEPKKEPEVKEDLLMIPEIEDAQQVFGAYDCIAKTKDLPPKKIQRLIANKIRKLSRVRTTLTLSTQEK